MKRILAGTVGLQHLLLSTVAFANDSRPRDPQFSSLRQRQEYTKPSLPSYIEGGGGAPPGPSRGAGDGGGSQDGPEAPLPLPPPPPHKGLKETLESLDKKEAARDEVRKMERRPIEIGREIEDYKYQVLSGALSEGVPGSFVVTPILDKVHEAEMKERYDDPLAEIDRRYADITRLQTHMEVRRLGGFDPKDVHETREAYARRGIHFLGLDPHLNSKADKLTQDQMNATLVTATQQALLFTTDNLEKLDEDRVALEAKFKDYTKAQYEKELADAKEYLRAKVLFLKYINQADASLKEQTKLMKEYSGAVARARNASTMTLLALGPVVNGVNTLVAQMQDVQMKTHFTAANTAFLAIREVEKMSARERLNHHKNGTLPIALNEEQVKELEVEAKAESIHAANREMQQNISRGLEAASQMVNSLAAAGIIQREDARILNAGLSMAQGALALAMAASNPLGAVVGAVSILATVVGLFSKPQVDPQAAFFNDLAEAINRIEQNQQKIMAMIRDLQLIVVKQNRALIEKMDREFGVLKQGTLDTNRVGNYLLHRHILGACEELESFYADFTAQRGGAGEAESFLAQVRIFSATSRKARDKFSACFDGMRELFSDRYHHEAHPLFLYDKLEAEAGGLEALQRARSQFQKSRERLKRHVGVNDYPRALRALQSPSVRFQTVLAKSQSLSAFKPEDEAFVARFDRQLINPSLVVYAINKLLTLKSFALFLDVDGKFLPIERTQSRAAAAPFVPSMLANARALLRVSLAQQSLLSGDLLVPTAYRDVELELLRSQARIRNAGNPALVASDALESSLRWLSDSALLSDGFLRFVLARHFAKGGRGAVSIALNYATLQSKGDADEVNTILPPYMRAICWSDYAKIREVSGFKSDLRMAKSELESLDEERAPLGDAASLRARIADLERKIALAGRPAKTTPFCGEPAPGAPKWFARFLGSDTLFTLPDAAKRPLTTNLFVGEHLVSLIKTEARLRLETLDFEYAGYFENDKALAEFHELLRP